MMKQGSRAVARYLVLVAVFLVGVLTILATDNGDGPPPVARVDVSPTLTHVQDGSEFYMWARARTGDGETITRQLNWSWTSDAATSQVVIDPLDQSEVKVKVVSPPAQVTIKAEADGIPGTATLVSVAPQVNEDVAKASPTLDPAVVSFFGESAGACDRPALAFDARAVLGKLSQGTDPTCRTYAGVYSVDHAMLFVEAPWSDGPDQVGEGPVASEVQANGLVNGATYASTEPPPVLGVPLLVPVKIWIAVENADPADVTLKAKQHVDEANSLYYENRVGIKFDISATDAIEVTDQIPSASCYDGRPPIFKPGSLNVYYMDKAIMYKGNTCDPFLNNQDDPSAGEFAVILVHWQRGYDNTLAHEFGHALGFWEGVPIHGHTGWGDWTCVKGFWPTNLMWSTSNDQVAEARDHFSIGQAFRMNVHQRSWLNISGVRTDPTRDCGIDPVMEGECPKWVLDIEPLATVATSCGP